MLDDLREPARRALELLSAKLPNAQTSVVETYQLDGDGSTREALVAGPFEVATGRLLNPPEINIGALLDGAGTPWCTRDLATEQDWQRHLAARQVAKSALETLRGLPPDEQRDRVAAFREAEFTCAGGDRLTQFVGPR